MTTKSLQLYDYGWRLFVFYNVTVKDLDIVLPALWENGCSNEGIREVAMAIIYPNSGFTLSGDRFSIMGIGWADSPEEFLNTFVHEINHLQDDICTYYNLPIKGEVASTIAGDIAMAMYKSFMKGLNYA